MKHQLDNPVWNALITGNRHLAYGNDKARHFKPEVSPFAGLAENTPEHFEVLLDIVPNDRPVAVFSNSDHLDPGPWTIVNRIDGFQMMYTQQPPALSDAVSCIDLTDDDVPAMMELTRISPPGPFLERTIEFGGYEGIFADNRLVAMAGHRLHCGAYMEISAVCTHPDYTGRGYARHLLLKQIRDLLAHEKLPYLHVRADNTRAITIYRDVGFEIRTAMYIYQLKR